MARAEVASASVRSDSIKGLAQSIAKPAYRRLLTAEPALRRAVPALIIAFLVTICVGAIALTAAGSIFGNSMAETSMNTEGSVCSNFCASAMALQ